MRTFESEPMQRGMPRWSMRAAGRKPSARSASVVGHAQTVVPLCASRSSSAPSRVRRVDDGDVAAEAAGAFQQLDRPAAVLGQALLDLARLLARVDVQRETLGGRVASELLEPVARAGADGVGGEADSDAVLPQRLQLPEILGGRLLAHPRQAAARVGGEEEDEVDARVGGRFGGRARLLEPEVVELADRRVAGVPHLGVRRRVELAHGRRRLPLGLGEHQLAPGPEVAAAGPTAQRTLKRVRVRVHEARQGERFRHAPERRLLAPSRARARLHARRPDARRRARRPRQPERAPDPDDGALEPAGGAQPRLHGGDEPSLDLHRGALGLRDRPRARRPGNGLRRRLRRLRARAPAGGVLPRRLDGRPARAEQLRGRGLDPGHEPDPKCLPRAGAGARAVLRHQPLRRRRRE